MLKVRFLFMRYGCVPNLNLNVINGEDQNGLVLGVIGLNAL